MTVAKNKTHLLNHVCVSAILLLTALVSTSVAWAKPLVIAHRGASGYLPEHTTEALVMAYMQEADYIEQDLVLSKDGELVVLHDIHLDTSTNVAEMFPNRKRKDNRYYAIDFTLKELKTLTVKERINLKTGKQVFPNRYQQTGDFKISTLQEHISLILELNRQLGKSVGLYIEIKAPEWHLEQGQDIAKALVSALDKAQLNQKDAPVYVQCFDFNHTKRLKNELGLKTKLVQLIAENSWGESSTDYDFLQSKQGLEQIKAVADGIGPWIPQLVKFNKKGYKIKKFAKSANDAGLVIHPYTFRNDALPKGIKNSEQLLDILFKELKVDGVFTDFTDTVYQYLNKR